ncbi:MAG: hypothetical protein ABH848_02530 [Candidatus Omnitrophota bacterium]
MKKCCLILLILICLCPFLYAETTPEERRVEEEKREVLLQTEDHMYEKKPSLSQKTDQIFDMEYFRSLLERRITSFKDICGVLVLLIGEDERLKDFDSQVTFLKKKKIIPKEIGTDIKPEAVVRKGTASIMFTRALGLKGGVFLRIFKSSKRYALRELVFEGMMISGRTDDLLSGKELVFTLTKAADHLAEKRMNH